MAYEQIELHVNSALNRLELAVDGSIAFIDYKLSDKTIFLIHTEVPPALGGKGVGNAIVEKALQYAKDNGYKIVPLCVFVQAYLKRHPQWEELVSPDAGRFIDNSEL